MANILSGLGNTAASTVGQTAAYAGGTGGGRALEPLATTISQVAWALEPIRAVDALLLAEGVAQGQVDPDKAQAWASAHGFGPEAFAAMVEIANTGPPLGAALDLLRRGTWDETQYKTALKRMGIEESWYEGLTSLQHDRLDLGAIATAVHRGIMEDAGLLVTPVPDGPTNVPRIPVSTVNTLKEFAAQGIDPERARVLVADTGLPLSLGEMLQLYNRGKVTATDVQVSIAESNVRNEYMDVALDLSRRLLTPHEYAEAELRGVKTPPQAKAGAALSGLDGADYDTLFAILGRPLALHQITTGLARGATYGGTYDDVPAGPYRDAIRRSAVRPEYASLDYANRYTYPSAFVLRSLAQAGDLGDEQAVEQILLEIGWKQAFAKQVAEAWMSEGAALDPHVKKAQSSLFTEAHKAYVKNGISVEQVTPAFTALNIPADAQLEILALWDVEKALAADVPPVA